MLHVASYTPSLIRSFDVCEANCGARWVDQKSCHHWSDIPVKEQKHISGNFAILNFKEN